MELGFTSSEVVHLAKNFVGLPQRNRAPVATRRPLNTATYPNGEYTRRINVTIFKSNAKAGGDSEIFRNYSNRNWSVISGTDLDGNPKIFITAGVICIQVRVLLQSFPGKNPVISRRN